jgi:serine palmitoyltransferase
MLTGSVANGLNSSGGFCAGSRIIVDHQRINGTSFVFSIADPALLAVSASEGINILRNTPLSEHASGKRVRNPCSTRPYRCTHNPLARSLADHPHTATPSLTVAAAKAPNPTITTFRDAPSFDITSEERLLQDIMDEVLAQGVWIARARWLRGQELVDLWPSIRLALMAALSRKECERAAGVVKATVTKVLTKLK